MRKVYIKLILILVFVVSVSNGYGIENYLFSENGNNECGKNDHGIINQFYNQYGVEFIKAMLVTDFALFYFKADIGCEEISIRSYRIHNSDIEIFKSKANEYLNLLAPFERTEFLLKIEKWLKIQEILLFPFVVYHDISFEFSQVISEIDKTKHLVQKHLSLDSQYWGSLSSSQNACLNIEVVTFVSDLNPDEIIVLLKEYFERIAYHLD